MSNESVTNVSIYVGDNEDLSRRVQEIVFAAGGKWGCGATSVINLDSNYIYINKDGDLRYGLSGSDSEISVYDFIASQGEQKWLPAFGEEMEFNDQKEGGNWTAKYFCSYIPSVHYKFVDTEGNSWKHMRKIKRKPIERWFNVERKAHALPGWNLQEQAKINSLPGAEQMLMREVIKGD